MCKLKRIGDLEIRVFVIGYKKEGEAIVVLFRDKGANKVFYSMAIDCYCYKGNMKSYRNLSDDILRKYRVEQLSVLCWTHPHMDHSKGLRKLFHKYCRVSTKVIKPLYFNNEDADIVTINDEKTKRVVEDLFKLNALNNDKIVSSVAPLEGYMMAGEFDVEAPDAQPKTVQVRLMSPAGSIIEQYHKENKKLKDLNGISVSLILDIDGYSMMFGGDTISEHISLMKDKHLRNCRFVKTPHHTSPTAIEMVFHLDKEKLDTACTTVYHSALPDDTIVDEYKKKTDYFFTTGYKESAMQQTYFGIVEYVLDFEHPNIHMNVDLYGNAHQL